MVTRDKLRGHTNGTPDIKDTARWFICVHRSMQTPEEEFWLSENHMCALFLWWHLRSCIWLARLMVKLKLKWAWMLMKPHPHPALPTLQISLGPNQYCTHQTVRHRQPRPTASLVLLVLALIELWATGICRTESPNHVDLLYPAKFPNR